KKGLALKDGMPLYKYSGNKILTFLQNKILNSNLSEFHSGYRAYSVKALKKIPLQRNTNDFHFDTQIIIQLLCNNNRIMEIPIPTYYGNEIRHFHGLKYAKNVLVTSLLSKLHSLYILYQREYDINKNKNYYLPKLGYTSSHTMALDTIKKNSKVLDLGCGNGFLEKELKKMRCYTTGVDQIKELNNEYFNDFIQLDLNNAEKLPKLNQFDYILMLDIIEHLDDPELLLDKIREKIKLKSPIVIITTPNIAFLFTRLQLLFSNFNYGKQGILDLTHKRLFTFKSLIKLCEASGYKIKKISGIPA
ncbi:unnamed protein product, partial [marine sediment metagenome]